MYITPRVLIKQEFTQLPVYSEFPLPAFIIGPNFKLNRYSVATERPFTVLSTLDGTALESGNSYNSAEDVRYDFPNRPPGSAVDPEYTKLFAEAVEAQYFPLEAFGGGGLGVDSVTYVESSSGAYHTNKIRFTGSVLKTANGHTRSAAFSNRDVAVNDIIEVTDGTNTVRAKIKSLTAETYVENSDLSSTVAAVLFSGTDGATNGTTFTSSSAEFDASVVGKYLTIQNNTSGSNGTFKVVGFLDANTLTLDRSAGSTSSKSWHIGGVYGAISNAPKQLEALSNSPVSTGTNNSTTVVANTSTNYVGYVAKAILSDTYTVSVTSSGDAEEVRFSISSASGAFTTKADIALESDGTTLIIDDLNDNNVTIEFTEAVSGTPTAFATGNIWTVAVSAAVTPISSYDGDISTGGAYTGATDMVYTVRVERGGDFYDGTNSATCARLLITASDVDTSKVVLPRLSTAFNVGSYGVTATFNTSPGAGLILGDVYYVPVTASKKGAVTVVELSESLPEAVLATLPSLTAKLYLTQASIQIPQIRDLLTGETNWVQEDVYVTVNSGITTYDNKIVLAGEPVRLPVDSAKLFVEHRDLIDSTSVSIDSVRTLADVETKLGTVHPDNPLAQGVYDAVLNSANQWVYFIGVATNDLSGYLEAIKISEKNEKVYGFVPLTFDRAIQDAVVSHVNAYSTPEVGRWRVAWISVEDKKSEAIYDLQEDGTPYQATITDDPAVTGTQYKLVTIEGAKFIEDGVRPNDSIRTNFRLNSDGKLIFDEYVVDYVRTNTTLVLTRALTAAVNAPAKVQVVRNYTKSERAANVALIGGEFNNRRVRCVFPDTYKYGGVTKQGYYMAAGLAGLRSGVVPHQGLTNSEFLGADDLSKVVLEFSQEDLDTMAEQGIWLVTQEVVGATPYVRHQLTTDEKSLNTSEDSITTNVDSISYALKKTLAPYIGRYNINVENLTVIRSAITAELTFRATSTRTVRAGNQLVSFTPQDDIIRLEQNSTYKDRIDVEVRLNVPYPMNYISLTLIV